MCDMKPTTGHPDQTYFDLGKEFDVPMYCSIYDHDHSEVSEQVSSITAVDNTVTLTTGAKRSRLERWLDRHNHKMEMLRTAFGFLTVGLQLVILGKLFNLI